MRLFILITETKWRSNWDVNINVMIWYRNSAPSVRKEVNFDVGVPGAAILSSRQVFGAQNSNNELVSHFVVP